MNIKKRIISIISETEKGKFSNIALNEYFKANPLSSKERGFITEVFYGSIRNKIFLDTMINKRVKEIKKDWLRQLLRISIYQITFMDSDEAGVVWEAAELAKRKYSNPLGKFVNGVLRSYLRDKDTEIEKLRSEDKLNILYSYPKWFYKKMKAEYWEDCENVLKSLKKIPYLSIRVNTLKYSTDEFENLLKRENINIIKKVDTVYYIDSGIVIYFDEFKEGKIIAQDGASYLAVKSLDPKPGDFVLDTCSAPGSKTVLIGELMKNEGKILALDIHPHKIKLIEGNAKKMGINIITPVKMDATKVKEQGLKFDKILVDAPCSGYGVIRKKPEALYNKNMDNVHELSELQYNILDSASKVLKEDGELIYSTCTITREENTDNVSKFLENNPDFESLKVDIPSNVSGEYDEVNGFLINFKEEILDNFYIVKLRRKNK